MADPPTVSITAPADNALLSDPNASIEFDAVGDGALVITCTVDGGLGLPCASPYDVPGLPDGEHTVEVSVLDLLLQTASDSVTFEVDATAPNITITSPTAGQHQSGDTVSLEFDVSEANPGNVECRVDGGAYNPCVAGELFSGLNEGSHTFDVQATDLAGHIGTASVTITIDATDPVVTINLPADGAHVPTGSPEVDFSVTDDAPVTIECSVDGGVFTSCSSPFYPENLAEGAHTVAVMATDLAGNSESVSVAFVVDLIYPTVFVTSPPGGSMVDSSDVDIEFTATDANLDSIECELDYSGAVPCASPWSLTGLTDGDHLVTVGVTDIAGNYATGAVAFTTDTALPSVSITSPADGAILPGDDFDITFDASDANGVTTDCQVDGGGYAACTSPHPVSGLAEGTHDLDVRATDPAGNQRVASISVTVDSTPPSVSITAPASGQHLNSGSTNLIFSATDLHMGSTTCSIDGGAATACTSPLALGGLGDGSHTAEVDAVDTAGNSASASVTFVVDTISPVVEITSPADDAFFNTGDVSVEFTATDANIDSVECSLNGAPYTACTSPLNLTGLSESEHTVDVRATDVAGNSASDSVTFTIESVPPDVTISSPTAGQYLDSTSVSVSFTATDTNLHQVRCSLDNGPFQNCSSPESYTGLAEGAHNVRVRATDKSGNQTIATVNFTVDVTNPSVSVTSPTAGQHVATTSPSVAFTAADASPLTVECNVDGGGFATCTSPLALSGLTQGSHTVVVRATDAAGNETSISRTFVVDSIAPAVSITSPTASAFIDATTVPVSFTATDANLATVTCSIDGGAFTACTSPRSFSGLSQGGHTVVVRGADQAGNSADASVSFTVDTIDPAVAISSPAAGAHIADTSVSVAFTATDSNLVSVECDVDSAGFSPCTSPLSLSGLTQGGHTVVVRATDAVGRVTSVSRSFTVDTVNPVVSISSPSAGQFFSVDDVAITFSATDANIAAVECRVDADAYSACSSGHTFDNLAEGGRTLQVRATDQAGNSATASVAVTVDLTDPAVAITAPAAGAHIADTSVSVAFTATDTNLTAVECNIDGGAFTACGSPRDFAGLTQGDHTVVVRATDAAGRITTASRAFTVDTVAPDVSISSPTAGQFLSSTTVPVSFSATDTNLASVTCSIDAGVASGCTSPRTYTSLAQGSHTVVVTATDVAGNSAQASVSFTVDTIDPAVSISYPAAAQHVASTDVDVAFTATDTNALTVECALDGGSFAPCASPYELTGLSQGSHTVAVRATDPAGNDTEVSRTFTVDTVPPSVSISSPTAGQYFDSSTVSTNFSATDANGVVTSCSVDGVPFVGCTSPAGTNGLTEGSHTLVVRGVDPAGNVGTAQVTFFVDTIDPAVSVTAPTPGQHLASTDVTVNFSATDANALTIECDVDGAGFSACSSPLPLTGLAQGAHSVVVRATDPAGNATSVTRNFTVDTINPAVAISSPADGDFFATNSVSVGFSATDTNLASVVCSIDGGSFSACTSPRNYSGLSQGSHTVVVRATDQAGNQTEEDVTFTVDTIAPSLAITAPAANAFIASTSVNVEFTRSDTNLTTVDCRIDGGDFSACSSPYELTGLTQGGHTVDIRVRDAADNETVRSISFTVDTIAPEVAITSPAEAAFVDSTTVTAEFTATDANSLTIECRIDSNPYVGCSSPAAQAGVPQGARTVYVRATDPAGNSTTATRTITVDSLDPSITLSAPAAGAYLPSADVEVAFSATDTNLDVVECRVDGGTYTDCTSAYSLSGLGEGLHTVEVRADDLAGNETVVSRSFTVDTIDPTVAISSPTAGEFFGGTDPVVRSFSATDTNLDAVQCAINGGAYSACTSGTTLSLADGEYTAAVRATDRAGNSFTDTVSFSVDRHDPEITIDQSDGAYVATGSPQIAFEGFDGVVSNSFLTYECRLDGGPAEVCTSPYSPGPLADGAHTVEIGVRDRADNSATDTYSFTVDTVDPAVSITSPSAGRFFAVDEVTQTFTSSDLNPDSIECSLDGAAFDDCASPVDLTNLDEGSHTSRVRATDLAGNSTERSIQFTVDTIAPQLSISSPAAGQTVFASDVAVAFSGVDATALSYECSANGGAQAACGNPFTVGGLEEGGHSARIRATDRAGNTSEQSVQFSVDLTSPDRSEQFGSAKPKGKTPLKVTKRSRLIFRDEFTGSSLNRRKWSNQRGTLKYPYSSAYNFKKEAATYERPNVSLQNGRAVLTLKKKPAGQDPTHPYSSGMIHSGNHFSFKYGYVEARVLVPKCVGCWPAFWMLNAPVDEEWPPEMDIFEFFNTTKDKRPKVNFHWKAGSRNKQWGSRKYGNRKRSYVGGWHTYGLHWTSKKAQVFVDGKPGPAFKLSRNLPKKPNYLIFNLALQKGFNPTGERRMMIDYVRVWQ